MPIQNIDNYLMPNRSQEASIHRTSAQNKIPAEQRFLTQEVNEQTDRKLTRTNEADNAELRKDKFDAREKGKNEYFARKKKKQKKEEKTSSEKNDKIKGMPGSLIDIKL